MYSFTNPAVVRQSINCIDEQSCNRFFYCYFYNNAAPAAAAATASYVV